MKRGFMTQADRRREAQALLTAYCSAISSYREASGGCAPDREATLNAWASARRTISGENKSPILGIKSESTRLIYSNMKGSEL